LHLLDINIILLSYSLKNLNAQYLEHLNDVYNYYNTHQNNIRNFKFEQQMSRYY